MPKFPVEFIGLRKHSKKTKQECIKLIEKIIYANDREWDPTGADLAKEMNTTSVHIRKLIQIIRENATTFFEKGTYLVAGKKGYYITRNKKWIRHHMKKTHLMAISKLKQFNEAEKIVGDVDWETGV